MRGKLILGIYTAVLIVLAVITALSYNALSNDIPTAANSAIQYDLFFDSVKDKVVDLHITLPQDSWINMLVTAHDRQYYGASVSIDGTTYDSAGLRIKSNMLSSNPQSQARYSFKIKFNKFISGQTLYGLDELNLINQFGDPSFMREYLMLEAMHNAGMAAPLAVYVNLYINGNLQGLYLAVEAVDDSFLTRNFGDALGNLYEAEKNADLLPEMHHEAISHGKGDDINRESLEYLIKILNNMTFGKGEIESILDVDSVLKYIAATAVFGDYGGYLGKSAENYYLYQNLNNGLFYMIPCDVYTSFGAYKDDYGLSVDISAMKPLLNVTIIQRPLVDKLLAVEEYKTKYTEYVNEFIGYLKNIEQRINELDAIISPYVENDPTKFYTVEHYKANISGTGNVSILTYVKNRLEFLDK